LSAGLAALHLLDGNGNGNGNGNVKSGLSVGWRGGVAMQDTP